MESLNDWIFEVMWDSFLSLLQWYHRIPMVFFVNGYCVFLTAYDVDGQ